MYTCNHCKNKFTNQPFKCSNRRNYCSRKCIPESVMDKPYSFEYFNLVENICDIESRINDIKSLKNRIDLENEINDLNNSYTINMLGDDEGLYYKKQTLMLLPTLDKLYDKIHNIFVGKKYDSTPAVIIYWHDLKNILGYNNAKLIYNNFKEKIENFVFENVYFTRSGYVCKIVNFNNSEDKIKFSTITDARRVEGLFSECLNEYISRLTEEQLNSLGCYANCIEINILYHCVVCEHWELCESFKFYDDLNLYKCDKHHSCLKCNTHNQNK
jgi:hypothetical protein